ncbi:hypothetical protein DRN69_07785 [Candidatus Pacearchaeota archaeon]|nr:MAG: hypothetical protein DRN69_07785 [Candidatus Pacearchaeota archaeon]
MAKGAKGIILLLFLLVGLYFINSSFNFINLPEFVTKIDKWINLIGGIFIFIGGFYFWKSDKEKYS